MRELISVSDAMDLVKQHFGQDVILKECIWDTDISKIYKIKVEENEFILKIKPRTLNHRRFVISNALADCGIRIPRILAEYKGISIKEYAEGIPMSEYKSKVRKEILRDDLNRIWEEFGEYLCSIHRFIGTLNCRNYNVEGTYMEITDDKVDSIRRLGLLEYEKEIEYLIGFLNNNKFKVFNENNLAIIHGELHNTNNILVSSGGTGDYHFECVVDFDSLGYGYPGQDISQILRNLCSNETERQSFNKGYHKNLPPEELEILEISKKVFDILELADDLIHAGDSNDLDLIKGYLSELLLLYKEVKGLDIYEIKIK